MKRLLFVLLLSLCVAAPALADVTVTMSVSINAGPIVSGGRMSIFIKGTKFRTDSKVMNQDVSMLVDLATKQQLLVNHETKEVTAYDPKQAITGLPMTFGDAVASVKPLGQVKTILGRTCEAFGVEVTVPVTMGGETLTMKMSGPVWVAKDGPGVAEYRDAEKAIIAAGFMVSPMGQGPQAKGMGEVAKALADAGILMEQELHLSMVGEGQMAQMAAQMGTMSMTMTATAISTDPIPDSAFRVPEGYTKK